MKITGNMLPTFSMDVMNIAIDELRLIRDF